MEIWINSLLLILFTLFVITQSYRYFEFSWPEKYFGPEDKENVFISTNPVYYLSFRILPVLIIIYVILGTLYKAHVSILNPIILGFIIGFSYSINNDGRALKDLFTKSKNIKVFLNTTSQYIVHFAIMIALLFTGGLAGFLSTIKSLHWVLPKVEGLVDNIWAFFITILISYILYRWVRKPKETPIDEIISESIKGLDNETIRFIEKFSIKMNADPLLVKAVCIAENIERPLWVRKIENLIGFVRSKGTYGIMQVESKKPLSDKESIKYAVLKFFSGTASMSFEAKKKVVEKYNRNEKYIYLIEEIYRFINPKP